ncbi:hypothetical protein [Cryobacterium sp. SO1]|uniref:hypothetical protein n=1 Tax=Cryobacterium sp. SO1 TaxID=1897061 RepID=UPI001022D9EB|nr:hypothetical protein [Cryobacterium sp. SO1]RZI34890.1 hypothetical protein BJQ95_02737 [Cryobacterium sp. SO1]
MMLTLDAAKPRSRVDARGTCGGCRPDFDAAIFVVFAAQTYEILAGYEVPANAVREKASVSASVGGQRLTPSLAGLAALPGCVDATSTLQAALENLDAR